MSHGKDFFTDLVNTYADSLVNYAERRVGDPCLAEDLVMETLLVTWRRIDEVQCHPVPIGWLYVTLGHIITREMSRKYHEMERSIPLLNLSPTNDCAVGLLEMIPPSLSNSDAQLLFWRFQDSLDYDEIGEKLGISTDAAKQRVYRAIKACREQLVETK